MGAVLGRVVTSQGRGIGAVLVTAHAVTRTVAGSEGQRRRLAAVITAADGSCGLEHDYRQGSCPKNSSPVTAQPGVRQTPIGASREREIYGTSAFASSITRVFDINSTRRAEGGSMRFARKRTDAFGSEPGVRHTPVRRSAAFHSVPAVSGGRATTWP